MKALRYMLFTMVLALGVLGFTGTTHAFNWEDGWEDSADYVSKDENGNLIYVAESYKDESYADVTEFRLFVPNAAMNVSEAKFYSSNTKVAKFASGNKFSKNIWLQLCKVKLEKGGLYNGDINWVDAKYTYKKVKWNKQTFWDQKESYYYYRIPAVVK